MTKIAQDAAARQLTASTSDSPTERSFAFSVRLAGEQVDVATVLVAQPPLPAALDAIVTVLVDVRMCVPPAAIAGVLRELADRIAGPTNAERAPRGQA